MQSESLYCFTEQRQHLLSVSSISATASIRSPKRIAEFEGSGDNERDRLKNSVPSLRQSELITTFTVFSVSPGLNVTSIVSLEKSTSALADCGSDSDGVIMTVYGIDAVPVATTVTGIIPSASAPEYVLELKANVIPIRKARQSEDIYIRQEVGTKL